MPEPEQRVLVARDGVDVAYLEWGDTNATTLVVFVHSTGFCKELSLPVASELNELRPGFRAIAPDMRAHGDSDVPPEVNWWDIAGDIVELTAATTSRVIGVGHSSGGAVLAMADILEPGRFSGLVLVEPIVPSPPTYGRSASELMARSTRRRRHRFPSREAAVENWRTKRAFAGWDGRAMQAYADGGLREEAGEFVLKCGKESEAEFFMGAAEHRAWDRLGEVTAPVLLIAGEHSVTHPVSVLRELAGRIGGSRYEIVPDTGHMVWMQRPGLIAARVADLMM